MTNNLAIHWFRQDLRLADNPALVEASKHDAVLPIYILDDENSEDYKMGAASRVWLHHSLASLNESLGGNLSLFAGNPLDIINSLIERYKIQAVYWNRCYEPWRTTRDTHIKQQLTANNISVKSYNASLLWEPWTIKKNDGTPYKVFTPYYQRGCLVADAPRLPIAQSLNNNWLKDKQQSLELNQLQLLPQIRWDKSFQPHWNIGEQGAQLRLQQFIQQGLMHYSEGRNFPSKPYKSRLSPYLHFGEISPNQIWYNVRAVADDKHVDVLCSELGWREFSYSQLYYNPNLPKENLQKKFDRFPWDANPKKLTAWQQGQTGIPMVDAGMRELWQTGYMHNRVRMIVGSFLVKNLLLHWQQGERWFWDCLLDASLPSNSASWQWIAGCGADAAPYFRVFNPVTQGKKFDAEGDYIRSFIPELSALPNKYLFSPWEAPEPILTAAKVELGKTYPMPIVDLKISRQMALDAFKSIS